MNVVWLAFTPKYQSQRRAASIGIVGAHAFSVEHPRSVCGYVPRESAGDPAGPDARHCVNCERAIRRAERLIAEQTRHDVAASVARHADIDERTEP